MAGKNVPWLRSIPSTKPDIRRSRPSIQKKNHSIRATFRSLGRLRFECPELRTVPIYKLTASVFLREHDCDDALGDGWVGRIGGMHGQGRIIIIDLEKDC